MKQVFIVFTALFLLSGMCSSDDSICENCDANIDHMAKKISNYSCNPTFMKEAWEKITKSCETEENSNLYVGLMAESCANGELVIPKCGSASSSLKLSGVKISLENYTSETVEFTLSSVANIFGEKREVIEANHKILIQYDDYIYEGGSFHIIITNPSTDEVLAEGEIDLTFDRKETSSWAIDRILGITKTEQGYAMNAYNWL